MTNDNLMKTSSLTLRHRAAAWLATALACAAIAHGAERKPNFLFLYTDDHRWDAVGAVQREHGERARFPWFKCPHYALLPIALPALPAFRWIASPAYLIPLPL